MNLAVEIIGTVGTLVALLITLWKVAQWFGRVTDNLTALRRDIRRLEVRLRVYDRRIDRLEEEKENPNGIKW